MMKHMFLAATLLAILVGNSAFARRDCQVGNDLCPQQLQNEWLSRCAASQLPGVRQDTHVSYATRGICIRTRSPHTLVHEGGVRTSGDLPNPSITRSIVP